tara:strand:- start:211 stop:474 length:264 start_codon:yes stop_codon:yes gene_type:complete
MTKAKVGDITMRTIQGDSQGRIVTPLEALEKRVLKLENQVIEQRDKIISQSAQIRRMHTRADKDSKTIKELLEKISKHKRFLDRIRK